MLVDANVLLYAVDAASPHHERVAAWMESSLNGPRRVGIPWPSLTAFLRIATHPRALERPLTSRQAWGYVDDWLACDNVWIPLPTLRHAAVFGGLVEAYDLRGNLVPDGHLVALAIEHGLQVVSGDSDFARFRQITWVNVLSD
jgi:toxin-antitoxin system PIN domain toxin